LKEFVVDYKVTEKKFAFATKRKAPFFFVSASDGTNVVQVFETAMKLALKCKNKPPSDYVSDVLSFLDEVFDSF
jgi:Rab-like protein 2